MRWLDKFRILIVVLALLVCVAQPAYPEGELRVTFVNPSNRGSSFWEMFVDFMMAAADDLNIEAEVIYCDWNHLKMIRVVEEVVKRPSPPDYLIVINEKQSAGRMIQSADQAGVKVFLAINGLLPNEIQKIGRPREKHPNWIGEFIPDSFSAGFEIARQLIGEAVTRKMADADGKLRMVGIAGERRTHGSVERVRGLEQAIVETQNVVLQQVFPGLWDQKVAREIMQKGILKRYPSLRILWAASDNMAIGAIEGAKTVGKVPGKDILFGGCGWDERALKMVKEGSLVTSLGGDFMYGAWILVLLYDYHHGVDFISESLDRSLLALTRDNIDTYYDSLSQQKWELIDFKKFSKAYNKGVIRYDFSLRGVMKNYTRF
jgi:ABC-type sugar transport system substrate-binding protein